MIERFPRRAPRRAAAAGVLLALLLAACASAPRRPAVALPPLRLAPAALGCELALQQRLHFQMGRAERDLDALLEVDADEARLLVQALGQVGVRLRWDGVELHQERADWLPPQVRPERVLDDLQFAYWPVEAIRAALPPDWAVREGACERRLLRGGATWLVVRYEEAGQLHLENVAEGYRLRIESVGTGAAGCSGGRS